AAFGIFGDQGLLLVLVAAVIIGALLIVTLSGSVASSWQQRTVGLIVGGAAGNLIDRLRLGYVTDFIDIGPWPTFNLADTAITIGIAVIVIHGFASEPRPGRKINGDRAQ
ncbi:MAG: signal peptidase II, partial [Thermomicrobiales bacterium]